MPVPLDPTLIARLQGDHRELMQLLGAARRARGRAAEAPPELRRIKAVLLAHLKAEDARLYPALRAAAATDPALQRTLETFGADMATITSAAMSFFARHERVAGDSPSFHEEFDRLVTMLRQRIVREEGLLYPHYDRLVAPPPGSSGPADRP